MGALATAMGLCTRDESLPHSSSRVVGDFGRDTDHHCPTVDVSSSAT